MWAAARGGLAARLEGDEFAAAVLPPPTQAERLYEETEQLKEALNGGKVAWSVGPFTRTRGTGRGWTWPGIRSETDQAVPLPAPWRPVHGVTFALKHPPGRAATGPEALT